jgi:hypothetical protein
MKKLNFDLTIASNALLCPNADSFYEKAYITTADAKYFHVIPGVKNATKVATTVFPSVLQALDCTFAATASNLSATTVTVCPLKANVSICKSSIEDSYLVNQMSRGEANYDVQSFMNFYWDVLAKEINSEIESIKWIGSTTATGSSYTGNFAYNALCDGYEKLLLADANVVDVTVTAVTVSNVIGLLSAVLLAAPDTITPRKAGAVFYVSSTVATAFRIASALGNTAAYITGDMPLSFAGYDMVENPGMTDGTIVFTRPENLVYAFDGSESGTIEAIDQLKTVGIPNILTVVLLSIGFAIVNPAEIVWMH